MQWVIVLAAVFEIGGGGYLVGMKSFFERAASVMRNVRPKFTANGL